MTDVFSKAKRSDVMSRIRAQGNKETEIAFMTLLRKNRITGWRRHLSLSLGTRRKKSAGKITIRNWRVKPDFVFRSLRVAIFIDGCFWHGCPRHCVQPASNSIFWREKLLANKLRDRRVSNALRRRQWRVIRVWEHQLQQGDNLIQRLERKICKISSQGQLFTLTRTPVAFTVPNV
jgi:DNA mismatch endonuclease (patch repair protein)